MSNDCFITKYTLSQEDQNHLFIALVISQSGFPGSTVGENPPANQEKRVQSLGWDNPLKKEMATNSRIFAWKIPWTEETGGLQSVGSQRSGTSLMRTHARKRPRKVWARQPLRARLAHSHLCSLHSIHKDLSLDGKAVFSLLPQDSSICCPACMSSF